MIELVNPYFLFIGLPLLAGAAFYRWFYYREPVYRYSSMLPLKGLVKQGTLYTLVPFCLRVGSLAFLVIALTRLRAPDERSLVAVEGVDIMLVFDASGSMMAIDDRSTMRTRIDVARDEAIKFIKKRVNDPMGLVIFSGAAVTRCPLTMDKHVLEEMLHETTVETIPVQGTVLSQGILVAANRLKKSKAASRVMIVLTDGEPTPNDIAPHVALDLAKKLGIKIYTIGIGSPDGGWIDTGFMGWQRSGAQYNEALLYEIARATGGQFFAARKPEELEKIYDTIDRLERTEQQVPVYARYFEYFEYFLWGAAILLLGEVLLSTLLWVRL